MTGESTRRHHLSGDVVFVSAAPLDPQFPGGFSSRHASFVEAVSQRHPSKLVYLHDGEGEPLLRRSTIPSGVSVEFVNGQRLNGRDDIRLPRQAVARRVRSPACRPQALLVPLTASVAHVALGSRNAVVVLEEAWERYRPPRPRPVERAALGIERYRYRNLYRRLAQWTSSVVAITSREKRRFASYFPLSEIAVVPYGVDSDFFAPMPVEQQDIDILVVGAVNSRMDQRVEELVNRLRSDSANSEFTCVVVGGSPRRSILELASARVIIAGHVPDVRPYYARSKLVVVPTSSEIGIKTTMLQAWSMERPVVTTRSVLAATEHGSFQSSLATGDISEMVPVIGRLLVDPERRAGIGRTGRDVVLRYHQRRSCAEMFADLIDGRLETGTY